MSKPLLEVAPESRSPASNEEIIARLEKRGADASAMRFRTDRESGIVILEGGSEDELDAVIRELRAGLNEPFLVSAPMVSYREEIRRSATIEYTLGKAIGHVGPVVRLKIEFEPTQGLTGLQFEDRTEQGTVPPNCVAAVEIGLRDSAANGLIAGFSIMNVTARLVGASCDPGADARSFQVAAFRAFLELKKKSGIKLVEPWMLVEVRVPLQWKGAVARDLASRRGFIQADVELNEDGVVRALTPLACLFGYANSLRALTNGEASWSMTFVRYQDVPPPHTDDPTFPSAAALRA